MTGELAGIFVKSNCPKSEHQRGSLQFNGRKRRGTAWTFPSKKTDLKKYSFFPRHIFLLSVDKIYCFKRCICLCCFFSPEIADYWDLWDSGSTESFSVLAKSPHYTAVTNNSLKNREVHGPALNSSVRHPLFLPLPGQKAPSLNKKFTFPVSLGV